MNPKNTSALIGGLAGGMIATVFTLPVLKTVGCLACLGYVGGGLMAAWHYTTANVLSISGREGTGLGVRAGVVGGVVSGLLGWLFLALGVTNSKEEALADLYESGALDNANMEAFLVGMIDVMYGWGGFAIGIVIAVILSLIGGAIGAKIWKRGVESDV